MRYGDYDLRVGDRDSNHTYGGVVRSAGDPLPPDGGPGFVFQLQEDLRTLGFRLVGKADGIFGQMTEWAVREFQIYAKMPMLAVETGTASRYVDRLHPVQNPQPAVGPVSGIVDGQTRAQLFQWLQNSLRCPVVVEAWKMAGGQPSSLVAENIWFYDEVADTSPRMFVRDFSGHFEFPPEHDPDGMIVLGEYVPFLSWSGPRSEPPRHTWPDAEILADSLIGDELDDLTPDKKSTFKVVRAVSEVECIGSFDCLNAYDNAFVSGGPCHWTLGIVSQGAVVSEGELCGYLAYLRYADPAAFDRAIGHFGVRTDEDWVSGGVPDGRALFQSSSRKYAGWLALQQQDGSYRRLPLDEELGNHFKGWHWFYRFVMAGRTVQGWRRRMWDMARIRLRDIRATPFPSGVLPDIPDGNGGLRRATVGDVYTSEKATAILLRWHIRFPGHVIAGGQAGSRIRNALNRAAIPSSAGPPASWMDSHEAALLLGLIAEIDAIGNADLTRTISDVRDWPKWASGQNPRGFALPKTIGKLSEGRNSLIFHDAGLPPPPY